MDIEITTKKSEGVERLLEVSVPLETVAAEEEKAARRYATSVRLPGFRPGKAPPAMVRKRFKDAIRQQALETLVQEAYQGSDGAREAEGRRAAARPRREVRRRAAADVRAASRSAAEGRARAHAGVPGHAHRDARHRRAVREQIEQLRDQRATWAPVEEKPRAGRHGDGAARDAQTTDGEMPEGKEYRIVLGGGQAIAGIEELIMELAPGETVERAVKWPDDFPDEAQRGKTKTVRVTLQDVKRKSLPGARRRVRARGRRLRVARRAYAQPCATDLEDARDARGGRRRAPAADRRDHRQRTRSTCRRAG